MDIFIDGLQIIHMNSENKSPHYAAAHDVVYAGELSNMTTLDEDAVIRLLKLGWHYDRGFNCFAYFT